MMHSVRCGNCERYESVNDALRDRCGTLELLNEGLRERAIKALNCDYNVDLNGRVAVLQLDRAVRRIAQLERELAQALAAAAGAAGPHCPQCDSPVAVQELPVTVDPDTGYRDGGDFFDCTRCGERDSVRVLEAEEAQDAA